MARKLWLPPSVVEQATIYVCRICGAQFPEHAVRGWQEHVGACAREHAAEIARAGPKGTVFDEDQWDPEVSDHMREVGKRMIREGRLEVLPHERAGHS